MFASLDSDSEKVILTELKKKYKHSAIIVISHRLSTIKEVDEVICLKDGTIVEKGNPGKLITQRGHYWDLFKDQMDN